MSRAGRVRFERRTQKIVEGRKVDTWQEFHTAWADLPDLSMREQTDAHNKELTDAITVEVRVCRKVEEVRKKLKEFRLVYDGEIYQIHGSDYSRTHEGHIRLLAARTD